jgi:hypothetical protein
MGSFVVGRSRNLDVSDKNSVFEGVWADKDDRAMKVEMGGLVVWGCCRDHDGTIRRWRHETPTAPAPEPVSSFLRWSFSLADEWIQRTCDSPAGRWRAAMDPAGAGVPTKPDHVVWQAAPTLQCSSVDEMARAPSPLQCLWWGITSTLSTHHHSCGHQRGSSIPPRLDSTFPGWTTEQ